MSREWYFVIILLSSSAFSQNEFVVRDRDTLKLTGRPFYYLGTNAYYLLEQAARGDTQTVQSLFRTAGNLGMTVVRTWGFFDSADSTNPAVIQYRPGVFNQHAFRGLDYVVYQARLHGIRLLIPLVNNWDDYGGMNTYVRWRSEFAAGDLPAKYTQADLRRIVDGGGGRTYRYALTETSGHDDFYSDPVVKGWFRNYISTILNRVNSYTGIRYRDEPFIFGWELANEPRSSDRSGNLVNRWVEEMASYLKSIDAHHLVGTGEEGFDVAAAGFSAQSYSNQYWLFDGTAGVSFTQNSVTHPIDFASCHLYPELWNLPNGAGNVWIRDHVRIARAAGKPLVVGEFGVRAFKVPTYDSWLTTSLLDGAAGAMVWQVLEGARTDREGFGFRCSEEALLCDHLRAIAERFTEKSIGGMLTAPEGFALRQNYPNPFNGLTTISYAIPVDTHVDLSVFTILGQLVVTVVRDIQSAGERRELLDAASLSSGTYVYRLVVTDPSAQGSTRFTQAKKLLLVR